MKKTYKNPTFRIVMLKTNVGILADSKTGGVNSGDKPGDDYTQGDVTYGREGVLFDGEDEY